MSVRFLAKHAVRTRVWHPAVAVGAVRRDDGAAHGQVAAEPRRVTLLSRVSPL